MFLTQLLSLLMRKYTISGCMIGLVFDCDGCFVCNNYSSPLLIFLSVVRLFVL